MHSNSFVGACAAGEALGGSVLVYIVGSTGFAVVSSGAGFAVVASGATTVGFGVFGL